MRIHIETSNTLPDNEPIVGNVYAVKGGRGMARGNMNVLVAIYKPQEAYQGDTAVMLTITKEGVICGSTTYAMHYVRDLSPIAFVEGLDQIDLVMRSL